MLATLDGVRNICFYIKYAEKKIVTQEGALPDAPSIPIWATCLTSVGPPISISGSLDAAKIK